MIGMQQLEISSVTFNSQQPVSYIGHCYEIKIKIEQCLNDNLISKSDNNRDKLLYDGYLHLPEMHLLLSPLVINYVDIHGFAKEDNLDTPGLLYGVINKEHARKYFEGNIKPDGKQYTKLSQKFEKFQFIDVYGNTILLQC